MNNKNSRARTKRNITQLSVLGAFTLFFGFIFIYVLTHPTVPSPVETGNDLQTAVPSALPSTSPVITNEPSAQTDTPVVTDEPVETPPPTPTPYYFVSGKGEPIYDYEYGTPVPEAEVVGDDYFADAAFIGNSLTEGFKLYSGLKSAAYYGEKSISINNISYAPDQSGMTIFESLSRQQYKKIYIMLGINEISMKREDFREKYGEVIDKIREIEPDAEIYIQAITPVTISASENKGANFNNKRVRAMNEELAALAKDKQLFYIDTYNALSDDEGNLPKYASTDGVHFTQEYYKIWCQYLKSHTINGYSQPDDAEKEAAHT